jgi:replicative DNA helicase
MSQLFTKLDTTIDRMTDISNSITQMLAVHEQKIAANAEDTEDLFHLIEKRRMENDENLKQLHSRITTGNKEMAQEMNANVIKIMHSIEELKDMMISREKDVRREQAELEERINNLEKKQYFVAGAAMVFGFLAGAFDWISQIFS